MDPNELIERIRGGDSDAAIHQVLAENPSLTFEGLVGGVMNWGQDDVSEILLRRLLADLPEHEAAHDHLAELLYRQRRYEECIPHYKFLCARFPDRAPAYSRLCWSYFETHNVEGLRDTLHAAQRLVVDGHHLSWQAGAPLTFYLSPDAAAVHTARHAAARGALADGRGGRVATPHAETTPAPARIVSAATAGASEFGRDAAVLSGAVASTIDGAEYRFEYGPSPDDLSAATPWRPVPGKLNAEFIASPDATPAVFSLYATAVSWNEDAGTYVMDWPFGKDPNHVSGIGFLELICGMWTNSCQFDGNQEHHPHETGDLRDAELTLDLYAEGIDAKDFLFCVGVGNVGTYWMLSGAPFDLSAPRADGMNEVSVRLTSDPASWTAFGNNPREQWNADRYGHGPLHDALSTHMGNLVLTATFGDWRDTITGRLGIKRAMLKYRDNSILHPDNGTRLVEHPASPDSDVHNLTNGRRGDPNGGWFHSGPVAESLVFRWQLAKPLSIATLVLHQDVAWPTRKCRIGVTSTAGQDFSWDIDLPCDNDPVTGMRQFSARLPAIGPCLAFTLELLEGAGEQGLGLEAVELFATDHVPPPSAAPVSVCEEVSGLPAGAPIFYRAVCRADGEIQTGETRDLPLPPTDAPVLHALSLYSNTEDKAVIQVRANAMGHDTIIRWRVDDGEWRETALGWEKTAAHRYLQVHGPSTGDHKMEALLKSEAGESPTRNVSFTIP
jgi:hypothetical protein